MSKLLELGDTCSSLLEAPRSGLLIDGRDFYRAIYQAMREARRSIVMAGWQFDSTVELLRGDDRDGCDQPAELLPFLVSLCEERPELEIHLLAWDASAVFAFEREPMQKLVFERRGHERIHFRMDNCHPTGASQHQKIVIVDRSIAFVGGMDVCTSRWDDREHLAVDPRRTSRKKPYHPYHDVQAYMTGDPVDALRDWFRLRWSMATGEELPAAELPRKEIEIEPSLELDVPVVGLSQTWPEMKDCAIPQNRELFRLHIRAIADAERCIYIESQYFSSDEMEKILIHRMERRVWPPLEIVIVLPEKSAGFKERISIGVYQARILRNLSAVAERTGHKLGVYYSAAPGPEGDVPVFIHSKILAVDDRFLLVSSANLTNRSMSFDSELGVAWESESEHESIRAARVELMREHAGMSAEEAAELEPMAGLVDRLDAIAVDGSHRLRVHRLNQDEVPGWFLSRFVPADPTFDPDHIEDTLPEPEAWLDRFVRDPLILLGHGLRHLKRRVFGGATASSR